MIIQSNYAAGSSLSKNEEPATTITITAKVCEFGNSLHWPGQNKIQKKTFITRIFVHTAFWTKTYLALFSWMIEVWSTGLESSCIEMSERTFLFKLFESYLELLLSTRKTIWSLGMKYNRINTAYREIYK